MSAKEKKVEKTEVTTTVSDVMQEKGKQSSINIKNGKDAVIIKLDGKVRVRFKKDYGYMKKDVEVVVSDLAYEVYAKAGVVDKI